ncbi:MAG TPA: tRNA preQ1(34) S-adenosylmethionine ribosyltransferase-isomerase QueA [Labilithrix sp.]|nr:tRNA preQ1(34) S-adenosylmethionine ribosyltransferase-isomerase QueA [Labilithrix sp.]
MRVERFNYELPPELIAQEPASERELARMLVLMDDEIQHRWIKDLAEHIPSESLIVVNDTKVIRARILGAKEGSGGKAEVFLVRREPDGGSDTAIPARERWRAMARASKALRPGTRIISGPLLVEVEGHAPDGLFLVRLSSRDDALSIDEALLAHAKVPLPPYIKRDVLPEDEHRYQTVFARTPGAVAAPTAGLHLTQPLMHRLESLGCEIASCTLHVGLGTFQPVTAEDLDNHVMHAEYFEVPRSLATAVSRARERGAPVVAVGTTVVRALESAADPDREGYVRPCAEETRILIQPGHRFRVVDHLLTNFHLPKSTLLALVSAFAGTERVLRAYRLAVKERYRFFSYGDAMLLSRRTTDLDTTKLEATPSASHESEAS